MTVFSEHDDDVPLPPRQLNSPPSNIMHESDVSNNGSVVGGVYV